MDASIFCPVSSEEAYGKWSLWNLTDLPLSCENYKQMTVPYKIPEVWCIWHSFVEFIDVTFESLRLVVNVLLEGCL